MLDVPVPQVILDEPRIRSLVGKREAASVAKHVRMSEQGQFGGGAVSSQGEVDGRAMQRLSLFADKKRRAGHFHAGAFFQPELNRPQFVIA